MGLGETYGRPSFENFTNTFVLSSVSSTPNSGQHLCEIPRALATDAARQRRGHRKSRAGCDNCKKRRVKCDEKNPCSSCIRRGQACQRLSRHHSVHKVPAQVSIVKSNTVDNNLNLLHLKLYHHFQVFTVPTLLFSTAVWEHALQLSFQFDFLANTIFCLAARHLNILQPEDKIYSRTAATHLSRALSQFRRAISKDFTSTHIDAFIATSLLLQYELWNNTDDYVSFQENRSGLFSPSGDLVFAFCSSLKKVFKNSVPLLLGQPSLFMSHIRIDPKDGLVNAAQISDGTLTAYQNFFSYNRPLDAQLLELPLPFTRGIDLAMPKRWRFATPRTEVPQPIQDTYTSIISQICLILSFLPEAQPPESPGADSTLFPKLVTYILSFPVMCHGTLNFMIQNGDPHALVLLYHFYRAVRILLGPSKCWWVHKRAVVCESALKEWLTRESAAKG